MTEVITRHGEDRIAQCQGTGQVLTIDKFVLSYDPTIDPTAAIDRDSLLPPTDQIVYSHDVTKSGYINPSQVVYSLFMDSTVGPFQFNRMDLVESATNINIAIATIGTQTKVADDPQNGIRGQAMTRNFMTIYDSAAEITNISVDAASWQIDFIARLKASDELERLTTRDIWGRNCFWGDAFKVTPAGGNNNYQLGAGRGFVEGVRIHSDGSAQFIAGTLPTDVWLDVSLQGDINGVQPKVEVVLSNTPLSDSTDGHQVYHFMERIASLDTAGNVTDLRNSKAIGDTLLKYIDQQDQQVNGDMSAEITSQISGLRSYIDNKVPMAKVPKIGYGTVYQSMKSNPSSSYLKIKGPNISHITIQASGYELVIHTTETIHGGIIVASPVGAGEEAGVKSFSVINAKVISDYQCLITMYIPSRNPSQIKIVDAFSFVIIY